jgi:hypothetical protein
VVIPAVFSIPNAPACSTFSFKGAVWYSLNLKTCQILPVSLCTNKGPMGSFLCDMVRGTAQRGVRSKEAKNEGLGNCGAQACSSAGQ